MPWRHMGEKRYISYSYLTSAVDAGEWSASRPGRALPPRKGPPVPIVQEVGWAPELVWTQGARRKILCLCRGSNSDRPAPSQTLYCLSYIGSNNCLPQLTLCKYWEICLAEFGKHSSSSALLRYLRLSTDGNLPPGLVLVWTQLDTEQVSTRATLVRLFSQLPLNSNRGPPLALVPCNKGYQL
jgi:hypothetical protein